MWLQLHHINFKKDMADDIWFQIQYLSLTGDDYFSLLLGKWSIWFTETLSYVLNFFKRGDTIQGGTLFKEIGYMRMIFPEECTFRHQEHNRSKNTKKIAGEWVIESCGTAIAFSIFGESIFPSHSINDFSPLVDHF